MELYENEQKQETAVLVSVDTGEFDVDSSLLELAELTKTAGAEVIGEITQKREAPDSATYIGKGKLEELSEFCEMNQPDLIIVDGELSPSQQRNIENITDVRVIDRTTLILDIFAMRALSGEGKLQVELAQLKYTLPRLSGKGLALSRLGGGIGTRGPGETKLETDRRHIRRRISALEANLKETAPHIVSVSFKNCRSEVLLHSLEEKGVYVSSGSACSSNHPAVSGTLKAIGVAKDLLDCTLRFSFCVNTTEEEIEYAIACLEELVPVLSRYVRKK